MYLADEMYVGSIMIQNTVLEFQFRSVKYMVVTRLHKNFEQLSIPIQAIQGNYSVPSDVNKPLQNIFKRVYTICTYSNGKINQFLHC